LQHLQQVRGCRRACAEDDVVETLHPTGTWHN
jgi:hypothetical protein